MPEHQVRIESGDFDPLQSSENESENRPLIYSDYLRLEAMLFFAGLTFLLTEFPKIFLFKGNNHFRLYFMAS